MSFTNDPLAQPFIFNGSTTDNYQYLRCPGSSRLTLQITNASILIGYGVKSSSGGSAVYATTDEPFLPVTGGIDRPPFDEIRIKSLTPGAPAIAYIRAT